MVGIYKITNKLNNKVYIGQSNNLERRRREHFDWNLSKRQYIDEIISDIKYLHKNTCLDMKLLNIAL